MLKQIFTWKKKSYTEDSPENDGKSSPTSGENKMGNELNYKNQVLELEEEVRALKIQLLKSSKQLEGEEQLKEEAKLRQVS